MIKKLCLNELKEEKALEILENKNKI